MHTAYMFWDMNSCQLSSMDNSILDKVQPSFLNLVSTYGCSNAVLRGYCNYHDYQLKTDEIWALGQYNVGVTRFMDSSSVMEAERELLTKIIQDHKPSLEEQPGLPLFLTSGNLDLINEVYVVMNGNMVLCTDLPEVDPAMNSLIYNGMDVYQWHPSKGVGRMYVCQNNYSSEF